MYNAYVISLNNPTKLLNKLSNYNLNPILIEGVNGSKLSTNEINQNTTLLCSMFCPKSVVGIAMSHIKSWKEFIKSKQRIALYFEDDDVFVDKFRDKLDITLAIKTNLDLSGWTYIIENVCHNYAKIAKPSFCSIQQFVKRLNTNSKEKSQLYQMKYNYQFLITFENNKTILDIIIKK